MGIAAAAASAKVRNNSTGWLTTGKYGLLQVTALKEIEKKGLFIAELDVLESEGAEAIEAGLNTSYCVDCLRFEGSLAGEVKTFLAALTQTPIDEIDEDGIEAALTTDQPCVGMLVKCRAFPYTTKNDRTITRYTFFPATEEDGKRAAELRVELGMAALAVT